MTTSSATARAGAVVGSSLAAPAVASYGGAALYVVAPHAERYPATLVGLLAFFLAPLVMREVRPRREPVLCPLNWILLVFCVQLVIVPVLVCYAGTFQSTLPVVPGDVAVNRALLVSTLAFLAFAVGYQATSRAQRRRPRRSAPPWRTSGLTVAAFVILGLIGIGLTFGSLSGLLTYYSSPTGQVGAEAAVAEGDIAGALGLFLRPFLGFGCVLAWCHWVDARPPGRTSAATAGAVTALAVLVIVLSYGTFSYNRGAFAAPLVALAAVFMARVRRVPLRWLLVGAVVALVLLTASRAYRNTDAATGQSLRGGNVTETVIEQTNLNRELQLYGGGPQFLGFLLDRTNYAQRLHYGETLLASALYPVPALGEPFRHSSGVEIYNRLIYGIKPYLDQVIPATGELFMNYHVPGVLLGFFVIGTCFAAMQRRFISAPTSAQAFAWQYAATWLAFLVVGSFAVVSQVFVYFFWPVYALAAISWIRRSR